MASQTFDAVAGRQEGEGCSAACCRMVIFPHQRLQTFLEVDSLRDMLGFPNFAILVDSDGEWSVAVPQTCRHLDAMINCCTVYGTPRRPCICSSFSADHCWRHRNFASPQPPELVRLDMERFETMLPLLAFDDRGHIVPTPTWEQLRAIAGSDGPNRLAGWPAPGP